jgi:L-lactate dehydrogenase complex protein LldF
MSRPPHDFARAAAAVVADRERQAVLRKAMAHIRRLRRDTVEALPDFAARRDRAAAARDRALADLPDLLVRLDAAVTAAGGVVHWAEDGPTAAALVTGLLASRGARLAVKGKSMIGEEIGLTAALGQAGIEAVETDLGEYIIQLAGQAPSHIISPALHLSREEVAALFSRKLGRSGQDIPSLTRLAREALRRKFLAAEAGITGVNLAVAATGTLVLLENEGNIRLSTTCPPLHVAVMSLEKVVADFDDAAAVLDILPLAATGQTIPVHLSLLTGPRRVGEGDGPRELHLVILDNGRSRILADPDLRQVLRCIRCGACLNVCPVYQRLGGHAYGSVYPGPMGSVLSPLLADAPGDPRQPFACTHCGACAAACPVGIDHPALLGRLRQRLAAETGDPATVLFAGLARHPGLFAGAAAVARLLDADGSRLARLAPASRLGRYLRGRRFPGLARPFSRTRAKGVRS